MRVSFRFLKEIVQTKNITLDQIQFVALAKLYVIRITDGPFEFTAIIPRSIPANSEQADFESNFQPEAIEFFTGVKDEASNTF